MATSQHVERGRISKRKPKAFLRDGEISKREQLAFRILGYNIVCPADITVTMGLVYTREQLQHFADTFPSEAVLRELRANNFALVAGPPKPMSLLEVRDADFSCWFYTKTEGWYSNAIEKFAVNDKAPTGWLAIRKEPVSNSRNRNWNEQLSLISDNERVPNAGEMSWFLTIFFNVRGVRLFEFLCVRTSSVDSGVHRVHVGSFDKNGLRVHGFSDDIGHSCAGLASAYQLTGQVEKSG